MNDTCATPPLRVGLISLGCAKNLVDAEIMLGSLLQAGLDVTSDPMEADALIVNTCSFIDAAQEESVDAILESGAVRDAHHRGQALVVSGCLPQRFRDELPKLLPEVDAFMGIDQVVQAPAIVRQAINHRRARTGASMATTPARRSQSRVTARLAELETATPREGHDGRPEQSLRGTDRYGRTRTVVTPGGARDSTVPAVVDVHARPQFIPDFATPRFRLTPRHFAYVKIAEGCNHPCSFCIIPRMRGSHRSRPQADVVREARQLLADGVKELNLISQDSTYYGLDLRPQHSRAIASPERFTAAARSLPAGSTTLGTLLRELNELPGEFWIRLLYTHPAHWTDELIQTIAECPKVARYVDMPLQHIHQNMLERMRRETSERYIRELIARIRAGVPGIALRTTFIVGFPGETAACFETLVDFIRETKFERLGVFAYSREEDTRAAGMAGQIPDRVKQERRALAMAAQRDVARGVQASFVGRTLKVLVEGPARTKELKHASEASWEHGLTRQQENGDRLAPFRHGLVARGEADAPDIDGRVYVRGRSVVGAFARVKVIGHTDYDLLAEPA